MPDFAPQPMQLPFEQPGNSSNSRQTWLLLIYTGGTRDYRGAHQMS